jgi:putative serine protease PepD
LIVGVDGERVKTAEDLLEAVDSKSPGDRVVITVVREGQEVPVEVTLDEDE